MEKILTEKEAENLWKKSNQNFNGFTKLKSKIIMKYFPKIFEKKIMESANSEYKSTPVTVVQVSKFSKNEINLSPFVLQSNQDIY
ncbi:hypothetical protein [Galbibacter sp. BG1]